ncbi:glycosyltransferase family 2 protein [Sinomonas humi]|uniref:Glycosyltransferase 2-like domain-containing protein n=1 Tax=Sinomonas humi TaxID=1338436 RepID=A0A0B2ADD6_9MICC|nr:glycosyltransferase [Sinomonas humi]KHL01256.1 hypothetical protein LK10_17650 [Sinomonas humi]
MSAVGPRGRRLVSVVVPCYKYGHFLGDSVGSVLAQDDVDVEVIIVDDASPDDSVAVARELAAADDRVRVIAHDRNSGHIATYNEGLAQGTGDYLVLLSADDALGPGALARAVSLMESRPNVGFTYGTVTRIEGEIPHASDRSGKVRIWDGHVWLSRRCRRATNCIFSPEVVMRRSLYARVGPYRKDLPHTGDLAMWLRAAALSDVAFIGGPPAAFYRVHGSNMHSEAYSAGRVSGMIFDLEQRRLAFRGFADLAAPDGRNRLEHLAELAMRNLSAEALAAASRAFAWGLTESWPLESLIGFAIETWPEARDLPQWRRLEFRMGLGPQRSVAHPGVRVTEKALGLRRRLLEWREAAVRA